MRGDVIVARFEQRRRPANGLRTSCVASADNITSVAVSDIVERIGSLGAAKRQELDEALRVALDLDT
jgi:mRNA-degrading endonuclease toxin of MazEF toxin-antitoxin module